MDSLNNERQWIIAFGAIFLSGKILDPHLQSVNQFDPPIPVLIQHLDNLLEPDVVRNLLNSLHGQQHLVNANHRLPTTDRSILLILMTDFLQQIGASH